MLKHLLLTPILAALGAATLAAQTAQPNVSTIPVSAARSQPAPTIVQQVRVAPGQLGGRILDGRTRRPVAGHKFQVLDANGKTFGELTSTVEGTYTTPTLTKGNYTLQVREDLQLHLSVTDDATINTLDIVVPQGPAKKPNVQDPSKVPAAPGGAAPRMTLPPPAPAPIVPGLGVAAWAVIAGGTAAAAVAAPVIANNIQKTNERGVSPNGQGPNR